MFLQNNSIHLSPLLLSLGLPDPVQFPPFHCPLPEALSVCVSSDGPCCRVIVLWPSSLELNIISSPWSQGSLSCPCFMGLSGGVAAKEAAVVLSKTPREGGRETASRSMGSVRFGSGSAQKQKQLLVFTV